MAKKMQSQAEGPRVNQKASTKAEEEQPSETAGYAKKMQKLLSARSKVRHGRR
jgi:hypothetical protein